MSFKSAPTLFKSVLAKSVLRALILALATCSQTSLAQDAATNPDDPAVKLLEPGEAPLQTLRLKPKKGSKQRSLMKMKIDQTIVMKGQKLPAVPTPAIQFTIESNVTDVADSGDIVIEYNYPKVEIIDESNEPSAAKDLMEKMIKSMEGLSGSATISSRGFTKTSDITLPPNLAPQIANVIGSMKESMSRMSSPLPEEPVGVGGKWSVTQVIEANGIKMKQISTHTLKGIKGEAVDIAIELTQSADAQEVKTPGVPPGTTIKLQSLDSTGTGEMLFDSGAVFPVSRIRSTSKMGMDMVAAGQALPMQIEMSIELTVSPGVSSDGPK